MDQNQFSKRQTLVLSLHRAGKLDYEIAYELGTSVRKLRKVLRYINNKLLESVRPCECGLPVEAGYRRCIRCLQIRRLERIVEKPPPKSPIRASRRGVPRQKENQEEAAIQDLPLSVAAQNLLIQKYARRREHHDF